MIQWMRFCRMAWWRFDRWLEDRDADIIQGDRLIEEWFGQERMPAIGDTGSIVATPEDLAEIGIADPIMRPGRRYEGRHARPKDFEEAT